MSEQRGMHIYPNARARAELDEQRYKRLVRAEATEALIAAALAWEDGKRMAGGWHCYLPTDKELGRRHRRLPQGHGGGEWLGDGCLRSGSRSATHLGLVWCERWGDGSGGTIWPPYSPALGPTARRLLNGFGWRDSLP